MAGDLYPYNRWASPLEKLAVAGQGTALDTSLMNQLQIAMVIALVVLVVLTVLLTIAFIIHRRRINDLRVGHYGAADALPVPVQPMQQPVQSMPSQVPSQVQPQQGPYSFPVDSTQNSIAPTTPATTDTPLVTPDESPVLQIHEPMNAPSTPVQQQPPTVSGAPQSPVQPLSGAVPRSEDPFYKQ